MVGQESVIRGHKKAEHGKYTAYQQMENDKQKACIISENRFQSELLALFLLKEIELSCFVQSPFDVNVHTIQQAAPPGIKDNKRFQYNLGLACMENEDFDAALSVFRETGDSAAQTHRRFARLLSGKGYEKEAENHIRIANFMEQISMKAAEMYRQGREVTVEEIIEKVKESNTEKKKADEAEGPAVLE